MRRLIVTGPRKVTFEEVADPACPRNGLVVRARLTAVSPGTEIRVYRAVPVDAAGQFLHERVPFALPAENGYSMVGDVVEVGREVTGFAPGDRVFVPAPHRELAAVPAELAVKLPAGIPDEQAVFLSILEVGHIGLRRGSPALGETVAIVGQGVIGLAALAYCQAFGLRTVVVDPASERLMIARQIGAQLAVSPEAPGFVAAVRDFAGGEGADVVLEAASHWEAVQTAMHLARPDGKVVIVSRHTAVPLFNPAGHPFLGKRLTLLTSYGHEPAGHRWDRRRSFALTLDLLAQGRLAIDPLITHRVGWEQLPEVYARLDQGERSMVGVVVIW